ncbi:8-oxo-dGTP diphosphatase [Paenibacillus filicis]|uniref:8-oxo-dGTP diphosphatase n=1 Tax=Paenibacillus gyeongsangnamensis TaxID=3388067 RepID=A0ABT4QCI9_9BACL|nr:8-oxo-dGTP diphosphatase [Paenibacillus filicis]MCZ8514528.1 8-oxo-dGTP diphosphatase [Paenibacillus filicis]
MLKYTICFIKRGDELLLLNRERAPWMGIWNGVGGKLEPGETPDRSILREIREETGIELASVRFKGLVTWLTDGSRYGGMYTYLGEVAPSFPYPTPRPTEEGLLDWKAIDWILHPSNQGVAANIPLFLPLLLNDSRCYDHFCTFTGNRITQFVSNEINPEAEHDEKLLAPLREAALR